MILGSTVVKCGSPMPAYPHAIRLRGPWNYEVLTRTALNEQGHRPDAAAALAPVGRTILPADWGATLGREFRGRVRYRRRFNRPSGLEGHERVWLVVEGADACASATMNGRELGAVLGYALGAEFHVTGLFEASNELALDVELPDVAARGVTILRPGRERKAGGPLGEVRLEVRSTVFIRDLTVWAEEEQGDPRLHVAGGIGGEVTDSSLAVVVGGHERELLYGEVRAGQPFELSERVDDLPRWPASSGRDQMLPLEIKLVAGAASAWQIVRRTSCPRVTWEPVTQRLTLGNVPIGWPLPVFDPTAREIDEQLVRKWLATVDEGQGAAFGLREVLPAMSYDRFDSTGLPLFQYVPLAWAETVCPRLAHHPSIVAWAAPAGELAQADRHQLARTAFGRPWLASEMALAVRSIDQDHSVAASPIQ
ncbi:MAG TPA: hypothetical protein VGX76_21095 [Pirellulales bacterium]|nr:hypothetical protein [Pirellulales bacterium]